jgi:hypothetical protein
MAKLIVNEETTMKWPDGVDRTFIQLRKENKAWKKPWKALVTSLTKELEGLGATGSVLICRSEDERQDPGVAVWFSMKKVDFGWQQGLGLPTPSPTLDQIDAAFKVKAKRFHPDNRETGDPEQFKKLSAWKDAAIAWITGTHDHSRESVMAIDQYTEARLNLCAIRLAFGHIRGLARVGAPGILSQTLGAFRAKLAATSSEGKVL